MKLLALILCLSLCSCAGLQQVDSLPNILSIETEQFIVPTCLPDTSPPGTFNVTEDHGLRATIISFHKGKDPLCDMQRRDYIELYEKYKDQGLEIVVVQYQDRNKFSDYDSVRVYACYKQFKIPTNYINAIDPGREVFRQHSKGLAPVTFILDWNGEVVYKEIGYAPNSIEQIVKRLITRKEEKND